ncbi:unnamed protein product [Notodromas monacha]|uniref:SCP domain-containing protein n=1 Tax=Notodromas monacha TaxID=399045 RepID=A0A7R9GJQ1_9CRUS|nr:unnamed protein product [Notodromas monacha]CAG0923905.1 unnamed protein product [Notodromas monacha]
MEKLAVVFILIIGVLAYQTSAKTVSDSEPAKNETKSIMGRDSLDNLAPKADYCKVSQGHTACKFTKPNELGACQKVNKRELTPTEKSKIVDAHNAKRRLVAKGNQSPQPEAADMAKLVWNDEAAAIAQLWVDQCTFNHDQERSTVKTGKSITNGQNLYMGMGPGDLDIDDAINAWFEEVKSFSPSSVTNFQFSMSTGHYSQLVWAKTTSIGCGFVNYGNDQKIFACNYGPAGNFMGQPVYKTGKACSACPSDMSKCDDGLCTK